MRGRNRTIKPEFFSSRDLLTLVPEYGYKAHIFYAGLWCYSDRDGVFPWEPEILGKYILPLEPELEFKPLLNLFLTLGMVIKFNSGGKPWGLIVNFADHQSVNFKEKKAVSFPPPPDNLKLNHACQDALQDRESLERKGKERKGKESTKLKSASGKPKRKARTRKNYPEWFETWWQRWTSHRAHARGAGPGNKGPAYDAAKARVDPKTEMEDLLQATTNYLEDCLGLDQKTSYAQKFLNGDWEDWKNRRPRKVEKGGRDGR